ncbi:MFS transporter [Polymorphospora rubra]|uniref:MFS transporter n=1 Tax=Polymorphospora rubra TaxID=338584 RepID=UPI0033F3EE0D
MSMIGDPAPVDVPRVQRRTLRLLFGTQIIGGIGTTIGISVGALLAARLAGTSVSGLAASASVVGGALLAVPVTRIMGVHGRRPGLVTAYLTGTLGALLVVAAAVTGWVPLLFAGMLLFGGGSAANLQARYTAVDLAEPARRGRQLSVIVWATTIGAVAAPNFAALADRAVDGLALPPLSGPFVFSAVAFAVAGGVLLVLLRPDPLLTAHRIAAAGTPAAAPAGSPAPAPRSPVTPTTAAAAAAAAAPAPAASAASAAAAPADSPAAAGPAPAAGGAIGMRTAWRVVAARPAARLGVAAGAVGHLVMVGVMAMTPVHLGESHGDADVLRIVGIVLSAHIAGMYALAPVVGWLTDRLGRRPVILGGVGLLVAACAVAGTAGHDTVRLVVGLVLLGLGWSATMVAGSTLLSESVPVEVRPATQGLSDLLMGLAGASAGAASGFIVEAAGYPVLNLLAAIATVPLTALALRVRVLR